MTRDAPMALPRALEDELLLLALERRDKKTTAEIEQLLAHDWLSPRDAILDLACGHGRHARALAQRGFNITGVDSNETFLRRARELATAQGLDATFIEADMRALPFQEASFDAVLCMWSSFGLLDDAGNLQTLKEIARVLKPEGRALIDTVNPYMTALFLEEEGWREHHDGTLQLTTARFDMTTSRIEEMWRFKRGDIDVTVDISTRIYTLPEWTSMLREAGLELKTVTVGPSRQTAGPRHGSWGLRLHKPA